MKKRTTPKKPPGHADADEYQRFLEVAREVEASDEPEDFDKAFERVTKPAPPFPAEKP